MIRLLKSASVCNLEFRGRADARDRSRAGRLAIRAFDAFARVDILINNADLMLKKASVEITEDDFDRRLVSTPRPFSSRCSSPHRIAGYGRIINMGTTIPGAPTIRRTVVEVLKQDSYRTAARHLDAAIRRDADTTTVVHELEQILSDHANRR